VQIDNVVWRGRRQQLRHCRRHRLCQAGLQHGAHVLGRVPRQQPAPPAAPKDVGPVAPPAAVVRPRPAGWQSGWIGGAGACSTPRAGAARHRGSAGRQGTRRSACALLPAPPGLREPP
jgi:hypothetical protein